MVSALTPELAGISTAAATWASNVANRGWDVTIVATDTPPGSPPFSTGRARSEILKSSPITRYWTAHSWSAGSRLADAVRGADIVHVHGLWHYLHYKAVKMADKWSIPLVLSPHAELQQEALQINRLRKLVYMRLIQRRYLHKFHGFHAITQDESTSIRYFVPGAKVAVIPNGLEPSAPPTADAIGKFKHKHPQLDGKITVLFLGRLHWKKGGDILLKAMTRVLHEIENVHLLIAGADDGYEHTMRNLVRENSLEHHVTWMGNITRVERDVVLSQADMYVLPSRSDAIGLATLEAMQAGVPVVISDKCGAPEIAENKAGFVLPLSEHAFAESITQLAKSPLMRRDMGDEGKALVLTTYNAESNAAKMTAFYDDLLATAGR